MGEIRFGDLLEDTMNHWQRSIKLQVPNAHIISKNSAVPLYATNTSVASGHPGPVRYKDRDDEVGLDLRDPSNRNKDGARWELLDDVSPIEFFRSDELSSEPLWSQHAFTFTLLHIWKVLC